MYNLMSFPSSNRFLLFSRLITIVCITLALVSLALSLIGFTNLIWAGFPDGHLTEYERATYTLQTIFLWMYLVPGLYFLRLAIPGLTLRTKVVRFLITLAALILLIISTEIALPWYFVDYLGLNNGRGG